MGGLGLINPIVKAKAFLIKSMANDYTRNGRDWVNFGDLRNLYGYPEDLIKLRGDRSILWSAKLVYQLLMEMELCRNNSLIPSRSEKKSSGIKWAVAWKNLQSLRGLSSEEVVFAWKLQQDMLKIGTRIHRPNADRRCGIELINNTVCQELQTRQHLFCECESVKEISCIGRKVIDKVLQKEISENDLVHLSFSHRDKKRLRSSLWFAIRLLYRIYLDRARNKTQIFFRIIKRNRMEFEIK